jgi:hypothetical protein
MGGANFERRFPYVIRTPRPNLTENFNFREQKPGAARAMGSHKPS